MAYRLLIPSGICLIGSSRTANAARSAAAISVSVLFAVGMALRAVCLDGLVLAAITTAAIFGVRDCLNMVWINAAPDTAQVIRLETFGNVPLVKFVRNPMRRNPFSIPPKVPVAAVVGGCHPQPASGIRLGRDVRQKSSYSLRYGKLAHSRCDSFLVASVRAARWANIAAARFYILTRGIQ